MRRASDTLASVLAWHACERGDAPRVLFEDEPGRVATISWGSSSGHLDDPGASLHADEPTAWGPRHASTGRPS